jgi:hypothetical protein
LEDEGTGKDGTDKNRVSFDQGVVDGGVDGLKNVVSMGVPSRCVSILRVSISLWLNAHPHGTPLNLKELFHLKGRRHKPIIQTIAHDGHSTVTHHLCIN